MSKNWRATLASLVVLGFFVVNVGQSLAATAPTGDANGLKVSPVRTDLSLDPGKSGTVTVYVENVTKQPATVRAIVNDFVANANETGQPDLILDENQYATSHSLKRFVGPIADITLQPGVQQAVTVHINVPAGTAGGGYYGAIRFAPAAANTNSIVNLSASVGSLVLLRVSGKIDEQLSIASFDVRKDNVAHRLFTSGPVSAVVRFQNGGNIQTAPFGKIILRGSSGNILSTTEINNTQPAGNVLPDSIRRFDVPLTKVGTFGKYKLEGNFGYGSNGQLLTATTTFYIIPVGVLIAAGIILLLIILAVIFIPKAIKAYNRRILRKAHYR